MYNTVYVAETQHSAQENFFLVGINEYFVMRTFA
jgi:hypothetical protein